MQIAVLTAAMCVIGASGSVAEEALDTVLQLTRTAYGGSALPEKGTVVQSSGKIFSATRSLTGTVLREAAWPDYLRVAITYDGGDAETRLMLGDEGWRDGAPAPTPMVLAMRLQAARLSLPMILWWERDALTDLGPAQGEDGRPVRRVGIDLGAGLALYAELDSETGRILRSAGVMNVGGAEMVFGAMYSEFRGYGDVSWHGHEDQSAMGTAIGWTRIDAMKTGLPFDMNAVRP